MNFINLLPDFIHKSKYKKKIQFAQSKILIGYI